MRSNYRPHLDECVKHKDKCKDCDALQIITASHAPTDVTGHHANQCCCCQASSRVAALTDEAISCQRAESAEQRSREDTDLRTAADAEKTSAAATTPLPCIHCCCVLSECQRPGQLCCWAQPEMAPPVLVAFACGGLCCCCCRTA